jgi:hypothetical protein
MELVECQELRKIDTNADSTAQMDMCTAVDEPPKLKSSYFPIGYCTSMSDRLPMLY